MPVTEINDAMKQNKLQHNISLPPSSGGVDHRKGGQIQAQDGIGFEFKEVRDCLVQKQKRFGEKQSQGSVNPADVLKQTHVVMALFHFCEKCDLLTLKNKYIRHDTFG